MSDGDPEDWPAHPAELRQLERALRCQICQELYQGPVALRCGHTFCSLCIRSSLTSFIKDGRSAACPTCREPTDQADLRPVTHLRDACAAWRAVRQLLLQQHLQALQQTQQEECLQTQQQRVLRPEQRQTHCAQTRPAADAPARHASGGSTVRRAVSAPAVTINSDSAVGSDGCEIDESDECGSTSSDQPNDSDPDWSSEDADDVQQQQHSNKVTNTNSKQRPRTSSATTNKRKDVVISTSGGPGAADDSDVVLADSDDDFGPVQEPVVKRLRTAHPAKPGTQQHRKSPAQLDVGLPQSHPQQQRPEHQQQQPGYVLCPICSSSVRQSFINTHIDDCLARADAAPKVHRIPQQQSSGRIPAHANHSKAQLAITPHAPSTSGFVVDTAGVSGSGSAGSKNGAANQAAGGSSVHRKGKVLEAPPKLCFELLKDKFLKAKLTALGLSTEGSRKACTDRYTAFRNFVLSLKDSGSSMNLKEAATEFSKQQRQVARAASKPQSLPTRVAAGAPAGASAAPGSAGNVTLSSRGLQARDVRDDWGNLGQVDNSYETLIRQTRERLARKKQQDTEQAPEGGTQQQHGQLQQQNRQHQEQSVVEVAAADLPPDADQGDQQQAAAAQQTMSMQLEVAPSLRQQQMHKEQHLSLTSDGMPELNDLQQRDTVADSNDAGQEAGYQEHLGKQCGLAAPVAVVDGYPLVKLSTGEGSQAILVTEPDEF